MSLLTVFTPDPELQVRSAVVGTVDDSTVVVTFAFPVIAEDYSDGITIEVDAVGATITAAARQSNHRVVHFTLDTPVTGGQTLAVVYDASSGSYSREDPAIDFDVSAGANAIGANYWFDNPSNSGLYLLML